ncbi:MAG: hypothetical protein AB3N11_05785, partial [Arenibacterium sp.]
SQKKGEDPEKAAQKIAKIVGKQAFKKFAPPAPDPEPAPEADRQPGQVTGKTSGIDRKIMNILNEVSSHYGEPIVILSGVRSKPAQAQAMYTNWQSHLRSGKDNAFLAKNDKLRTQLDALKQDKNKAGFIDLLTKKVDWDALSKHMSGQEVDLAAGTNPHIIAALSTCLNHRSGRNSEGARAHHFDNSKTVWPITESTRARWPSQE